MSGQRHAARGPAPVSPVRRRRSRLATIAALVAIGVGVAAFAILWVTTPPGSQAAAQVNALLAREHAQALTSLPAPDLVAQALIATEDSRFYSHHGVDARGAVRALVFPLIGRGGTAGGSTLDQQLAKLAFRPVRGGLLGKAQNVILGVKIDASYTKSQILLMYLNSAYFGHGFFGVREAAAGYFGLDASRLSWAQASLLAGLVQAPSRFDPLVHLDAARARQAHVLSRLIATGVLTQAEANDASNAPLQLRGRA